HEAESVPVDPALHHLAASKADHADPGDGYLLPGWCDPVEVTFMGTSARPTGHYHFAFGNDVLDRQAKIVQGRAIEGDPLLLTLRTSPCVGRRRVMVRVSGRKKLVCHPQIALVPKLIKHTTDYSFVLFRHSISPFVNSISP